MKAPLKILLTILVIFTTLNFAKSQDKIITRQNDTLDCRIIEVLSDKITYYRKTEEGQWEKYYIPSNLIVEYYKISPEEWSIEDFTLQKEHFKLPEKPFRISVSGGFSHLLSYFSNSKNAIISNKLHKNTNGILNGGYASTDFNIFLNEKFAIGTKYKFYGSKSDVIYTIETGFDNIQNTPILEVYNLKEKFYFNYIGFSLLLRQFLDKEHRLSVNSILSLGYDHFWNKITTDKYSTENSNYIVTSGDFAASADFFLEYYPLSYISISANLGVFYAEINKIKKRWTNQTGELQTTTEKINSLKMSRIDFSLGVQFYF